MKTVGGWIASILGVVLFVLACAAPAATAAPVPLKKSSFPGKTIRLDRLEWKRLGGKDRAVTCDVRPTTPSLSRPGTRLVGPGVPKGSIWFVSLHNQASVYRKLAMVKRTKKLRKAKLKAEAKRLRKVAKRLVSTCLKEVVTPEPEPDGLKFNFRSASAIATVAGGAPQSSLLSAPVSGSGLLAWSQSQSAFDPVVSGEINGGILGVGVAPDNDLIYADGGVFQANSCKLNRVDFETGAVTCLSQDVANLPDEIRFDGAGNAYFLGQKIGGDYSEYFRKVTPEGVTTDVLDPAVVKNLVAASYAGSPPIGLDIPFEVSPGGEIFLVAGKKLRRIKTDGGIEAITQAPVTLCGFKAGKLYVTADGRMLTYTAGSSAMDPTPWIGEPGSGATHLTTDIAEGWSPSCFEYDLADGSAIGPSPGVSLYEYYPVPRKLDYTGQAFLGPKTFAVQPIGSRLIINRKDALGQFAIDIYDHSTDETTTLVAPTGDLQVLHMVYSPGDDLIYFDGINYETFQNFLGTIDPDTGERRYLDSFDGSITEIFAFG